MRLACVFLIAYLQIAVSVIMHANSNTLYVQMEPDRPLNPPRGWVLSACAPKSVPVKGRFVFQNHYGYDALKEKVLDISNPCSPNYGKWLTRDQVERVTAIPPSQISTVQKYLQDYGVDCHNESLSSSGISFTTTVEQMEKLLHTDMKIYVTNDTVQVKEVIRIGGNYYLPTDVAEAVLLEGAATVFPLNYYPSYGEEDFEYGVMRYPMLEAKTTDLQRADWNSSCGTSCQGLWTPEVLRKRYHISSDVRSRSAPQETKIGIAVASFSSNYFDPDDHKKFSGFCDESVQATSVNHNDASWCKKGWNECSEGNLDTELCASLTQPTYEKVYVFDNYGEFYEWSTDMNSLETVPQVISVSYGSNEEDSSSAYKQAVDFELLKLAARGVTVVFASGDIGAYGIPDDPQNLVFNNPVFPASSPWGLAVGGTALLEPKESSKEVCSTYSGGGYSKFFERPEYQDPVITSYNQGYAGQGGTPTRGYPDVSAIYGNDVPYCIYTWNQWGKTGGTSAAAPVVASMFALLNQIRANVGGPRLGFANPWLYWMAQHHPEAFTDITEGTNKAWGSQGFPALAGWDACSGLGSLRFDILRSVIEQIEQNGYPQCNPQPTTTSPPTTTPVPTTTTPTPTTTTPEPTTTTPTPTTTTPEPTTTTPEPTTTTPVPTTTTPVPTTTTPVPTTTTPVPTTTTVPPTTTTTPRPYYYGPATTAPTTTVIKKKSYIGESIENVQPNSIDHLRNEVLSTLINEESL